MEIVPYAVEYLTGFKNNKDLEDEKKQTVEQLKQELFNSGHVDEFDEKEEGSLISDDIATDIKDASSETES